MTSVRLSPLFPQFDGKTSGGSTQPFQSNHRSAANPQSSPVTSRGQNSATRAPQKPDALPPVKDRNAAATTFMVGQTISQLTSGTATALEQMAAGRMAGSLIKGATTEAQKRALNMAVLDPAVPSDLAMYPLMGGPETRMKTHLTQGLAETDKAGIAEVLEQVKRVLTSPDYSAEKKENAATMASVLYNSNRLTGNQLKQLVQLEEQATEAAQPKVDKAFERIRNAAHEASAPATPTIGSKKLSLSQLLTDDLAKTNDLGIGAVLDQVTEVLTSPGYPLEKRQKAMVLIDVLLASGRLTADEAALMGDVKSHAGKASQG